jgi:hypothetical protein
VRARSWVIGVVLAMTVGSGCAWTQYGGSSGRTGVDTTSGLSVANVGQLQVQFSTTKDARDAALNASTIFSSQGVGNSSVDLYAAAVSNACTMTCPPTATVNFAGARPSDPVIDDQSIFVAADLPPFTTVHAFDISVTCSAQSTPPNCARWSATLPLSSVGGIPKLAIADGRLYVETPGVVSTTQGIPDQLATVSVFDAAGHDGCTTSGTTECSPLFQAASDLGSGVRMPTVADHRLYLGASNGVRVFDAGGTQSCVAGQCAPLYTLAVPGALTTEVVVRNGRAYVGAGSKILVFDATGHDRCGGSPAICAPLWSANLSNPARPGLVVTDHALAVVEHPPVVSGLGVEVYDSTGVTGCDATFRVCAPMWSIGESVMAGYTANAASAAGNLLVVSGWTASPTGSNPLVRFFDLDGVEGCPYLGGGFHYCNPLRTIALPESAGPVSRPAIAFNRIAVGSDDGTLTVLGLPG